MRRSWLSRRTARPEDRFRAALQALRWRGPDGFGRAEDGDWLLGVARLAITDPESPQPLRCPESGRYVLFNGAVTSAREDWRRFGAAAHTRNDAELALLRMRTEGPRALTGASGHYAVAVVDAAADRLWLARDPEGEKPLYAVLHAGRVVAFASTPASLRALGVDLRLDPAATAQLLAFGWFPELRATAGDCEVRGDLRGLYADGPDGLQPVPADETDTGRAQGTLRARIQGAVERCADAEVPVGLSLSGGVDSSCLAAALAAGDRRVPAYQFAGDGRAGAERRRAEAVAAATGHRFRPVDGGPEVLDALPALTSAVGLPLGDPSVLAAHAVARAAAADGVRVLLSGEGADELWLGYRRHRAARWLPARGLPLPEGRGFGTSYRARLLRALAAPAPYLELLKVSPPGFLRRVVPGLAATPAPALPSARARLTAAAAVDRTLYLRCDLLPKLDAATMAAGVEGRCPFLDPAVTAGADIAARTPRAALGKRPLKTAFAAELPRSVRHQRKRGFALPLDRWLRGPCALTDLLLEERSLARPHLDAAGLREVIDRQRLGRVRVGHGLYLLAALECYLRHLEETPCG